LRTVSGFPSSASLEGLFRRALARVEPADRVARALAVVAFAEREVVALALGKSAHRMLAGARRAMGDRIVSAICLVPDGVAEPGAIATGHPVPDRRSEEAGRALLAAAAGTRRVQRVLALISGGGSALAAVPADGIELAAKAEVCAAVARAGASIHDVNCVRKHLSAIKGGQLAMVSTAPVTTLISSDVVGDDPATVASGPTVPDPTTFVDAMDVVARTMSRSSLPQGVRSRLERGAAGKIPETPKRGRDTDVVEVVSGVGAMAEAMAAESARAGLPATIVSSSVVSDVNELAREVAAKARSGLGAFVWGGEPTIVLPESAGVGGRAQHLALLCARELRGVPGWRVLAAGTDGIDGNSRAAGAVVDGRTWDHAEQRGLAPAAALARFDAGPLFDALGCAVVTGPTGVNHADVVLLIVSPDVGSPA
jgi:glycerate-2-kinase